MHSSKGEQSTAPQWWLCASNLPPTNGVVHVPCVTPQPVPHKLHACCGSSQPILAAC